MDGQLLPIVQSGNVQCFPRSRKTAKVWLEACNSQLEALHMFEQFLRQFDHFPDFIWDCILAGVAIAIGLIVKLMLSLLLRKSAPVNMSFSLPRSIVARLGKPFNYFLPLLTFNLLLPFMKVQAAFYPALEKTI